MNRYPGSSVRARGFTLVELLVAVGIIMVLIAILVPVLSRARAHANVVRCLSRQRQLMQAMISYASENDGYLPAPNWDGGSNPAAPAGWLYDPSKTTAGTFQQTDAKTGVLYQYVNSLDIYRCNIDDGNWSPSTIQVVTSYMMNGAVCDYGYKGLSGEKLRAFQSTAILLWEIPVNDPSDSGQVNDGADWPAEGITTRHFHGSTVGFVDGHAELKTWTDFTNEWFSNAPGMLWCAPRSLNNDGGKSTFAAFPSTPPAEPANGG